MALTNFKNIRVTTLYNYSNNRCNLDNSISVTKFHKSINAFFINFS